MYIARSLYSLNILPGEIPVKFPLYTTPASQFLLHSTGVYISKISYVRRGERSLDGYYKPYHTVVYYRYLRFFPDGQSIFIYMYMYSCAYLSILSKILQTPCFLVELKTTD